MMVGAGAADKAWRNSGGTGRQPQAPAAIRGKSGAPTTTAAGVRPVHVAFSSSRSASPCGWPRRRRISPAVPGMTGWMANATRRRPAASPCSTMSRRPACASSLASFQGASTVWSRKRRPGSSPRTRRRPAASTWCCTGWRPACASWRWPYTRSSPARRRISSAVSASRTATPTCCSRRRRGPASRLLRWSWARRSSRVSRPAPEAVAPCRRSCATPCPPRPRRPSSESMTLIDSHCHLEMLGDAGWAVEQAREVGVETVVSIGIDAASSKLAVGFAERLEGVYATVGLHPHDAGSLDDALLGELEELAAHPRVVAVGECGLDFYRDLSPRDAQRGAFGAQIELARRAGLPLVVHVLRQGETVHDDRQ